MSDILATASRVYEDCKKESLMVRLHIETYERARYPFLQYIVRTLLGLGLACGVTACAPTLVGPTVASGYFFSMQVSLPGIWLGAFNPLQGAIPRSLLRSSAEPTSF